MDIGFNICFVIGYIQMGFLLHYILVWMLLVSIKLFLCITWLFLKSTRELFKTWWRGRLWPETFRFRSSIFELAHNSPRGARNSVKCINCTRYNNNKYNDDSTSNVFDHDWPCEPLGPVTRSRTGKGNAKSRKGKRAKVTLNKES